MLSFTDKRIVITGATSGIGKALTLLLDSMGAELILLSRSEEKYLFLQKQLKNEHHFISIDLANYKEVADFIKRGVIQQPIYGFVHSAGLAITQPLSTMKPKKYNHLFQLNCYSAMILIKKIYEDDKIEKGGSIVIVSSIMAEYGEIGKIAYSSSKGAITKAVRGYCNKFSTKKIRINAVLPGVTSTEMVEKLFSLLSDSQKDRIIKAHPKGLGMPEDIANLIIFLLSDKSRWITGTSITIDGGYSIK